MHNSCEQFHALKAIEQLSAVFTICVPLGTGLYAYSRFTKKLRLKTEELQELQKLNENRFQQIKTLQQALIKSDETIAALKFQRPDEWLKQAAAQRENGNEERAIRLLRSGFESIREPLSASCLDLAAHHFSLVPDYGNRQVGEAERQARLATLLCPEDENAKGLLAEILAVKAESDYTSGNEQGYDTAWDEVDDFLAIGQHPEIIDTLENQALQYYHQGHYRLAERLFRRLVTMCRRQFGDDSPVTLRMRYLFAMSLGEAGHYYSEALLLFQALLPDQERVIGKDHPDTMRARNSIAAYTGYTGDAAGALALFHALLPDNERVLGKDHPDTLTTRNNIAHWTGESGDAAGALALFQALSPDRERVQGKDHPGTLRTRNNIAQLTGRTGDAVGALALFQSLLRDQERVLGKDHPNTLATRNHIPLSMAAMGDAAAALALSKALLTDLERIIGKDHPDTLKIRGDIASLRGKTGDAAGALALSKALLPDQERVLGKDHPDTLITRNNIAVWTAETGDATGALALLIAVLDDRERVLGKDHPETQKTRKNIAVLQSRGDPLVHKFQLGNAVLEAPASGFQSSWSLKGKVSQAGTWEPVLPADVTHNAGES